MTYIHDILLTIILFFISPTNGLISNGTDYGALLAFKAAVNDPQNALQSWNHSTHFCKWENVRCGNKHRRVTWLILPSKGLEGNLTPFIGNLSFLKVLDLGNNGFHGIIPSNLGNLFRLEYLGFQNNKFEGEIPANLSACVNLLHLDLGNNGFHGIIPSNLGNLFRLQYLGFESNMFEGEIPANLSACIDLLHIGLDHNHLAGRIPPEITFLKKLLSLVLCTNQITGEIPNSIGNLTSLILFSADFNLMSGNIPDSIGKLNHLSMLNLGNNTFSGTLPYSIYNLSSLTHFLIFSNQIHGTLDSDLGLRLSDLKYLHVAHTRLSGSIPHSLSNATQLERISMDDCSFTGEVKVDFSHLKNLQELIITGNFLGGEGPESMNFLASLSNSSNLNVLEMGNNQFHGPLPSYMPSFSKNITYFSVSRNYLTGHIPPWITGILNLTTLVLDHNQFSGHIPNDIGKLFRLQELDLSNNRLSAEIPYSIGKLSLLNKLDLNSNQLQGKIPNSLGDCQSLNKLDLSNNILSEIIPKEIFQISSLSLILNLSHNQFSGQLPPEVKNLVHLSKLDLSHNDMSGEIPSSISSCTSLQSLYLGHNSFQGPIPDSMRLMRGLEYLDLSKNRMSGKVPTFLREFSLLNLNLSFNDFEGKLPEGGIFSNSTVVSFFGNARLCGDIHEPSLSRCRNPKKDKPSLLVIIVLASSSIVGLTAICFVIVSLKTRKKRNVPSESIEPPLMSSLLKLSYAMLHKATEGFSSKNFLGKGSFGTVYKGFLHNDNKLIAVKVLNVQEQGVARSFDAECNALTKLRHRNLVKILSACSSLDFQQQDFKALVYDFLPNGNLEMWLHPYINEKGEHVSKSLSLLERMNIAIDVAFAVNYLQNECPTLVVHSDIKPSNVLLDEDMVAHLGDFGLARIISDEDVQFQSSCRGLRGTIGYAAPEYGLGGEVSKKGDIYSFGILLLELITGKRPTDSIFEGDLNLNKFGKKGIHENIMEIVDPNLVRIEEEQAKITMDNQVVDYETIWKEKRHSIILMTNVAVACSMEDSQNRSDIQTAINELKIARDILTSSREEVVLTINSQ